MFEFSYSCFGCLFIGRSFNRPNQAYPAPVKSPQNYERKISRDSAGCGVIQVSALIGGVEATAVKAASNTMKTNDLDPRDTTLSALLRETRPTPELPPRFQENVWRRIEGAGEAPASNATASWLDALAAWILRPQLAFALAAVLVLVGVGFGWSSGERIARTEAQARYLSAVAPNALH